MKAIAFFLGITQALLESATSRAVEVSLNEKENNQPKCAASAVRIGRLVDFES